MDWDEGKRKANLFRHGLDFREVGEVLNSRYRWDVPVKRGGEHRTITLSCSLKHLAVLAVVHVEREDGTRIISFRRASREEREAYRDWLENEFADP